MRVIKAIVLSPGIAIGRASTEHDRSRCGGKGARKAVLFRRTVRVNDVVSRRMRKHAGLVLGSGTPTSHISILLRNRERPAVVVEPARWQRVGGKRVIVDGLLGKVIIDPDPGSLRAYKRTAAWLAAERRGALARRMEPAVTMDGRRIKICANVSNAEDALRAFAKGADGIGIVRTELTFMKRKRQPSEDAQYSVYRRIVQEAGAAPVVIRTFDLGSDKYPAWAAMTREQNPALGCRGLRYCLAHPGILRDQVAAVLRAACHGEVWLLLPMVSNVSEVDAVLELVRRTAAELAAKGTRHKADIPLGAMVEVPCATDIMPALTKRLDFFSIGTNDLIQYLEAVDRENERVAPHCDYYHPAVFRAIAQVTGASSKHVAVCGELAADPVALVVLVGLGVTELSMNPSIIPSAKRWVRGLSASACTRMAGVLARCYEPTDRARVLDRVSVMTSNPALQGDARAKLA